MLASDNKKCQFYLGDYLVYRQIEEGSQSIVYLASFEGKLWALKVYKHGLLGLGALRNELTMLNSISHQAWLKPMEYCQDKSCVLPNFADSNASCLVMEYYKNGDLRNFLNASHFPLPICRRILLQLLEAVDHIHQKNMLHRDIKPENILISDDYQLRLIDLGLAIDNHSLVDSKVVVGSMPFIAPQIHKSASYSVKSDIFALGVLYYLMATRNYPFKIAKLTDPSYILLVQANSSKFWSSKKISGDIATPSFKQFIQKILCKDPQNRPSTDSLFEMDQFQKQIATGEELAMFFMRASTA